MSLLLEQQIVQNTPRSSVRTIITYADSSLDQTKNESGSYVEFGYFSIINMRTGGSVEYRIAYAATQLPAHINSCRLIYDIRNKHVSQETITSLNQALSSICSLEFKK